ncbi:MAG: TetR/AcrR family transcriptional regulator [Bacteroidales bacterium]|nr:TetR/AcrR family transcriptional regulator [Bacteroidales bacterium]
MAETDFSDRQVQIINAAIKLIGEGGIQLLTTKNLAREVGVSEPALYRHFSNKVDLLRQVLTYLRSRIVQRLNEVAGSDLSPSEKLRELVIRQFTAFSNRPEVVVVLLSEGLYQNNNELSAFVFSIMQVSSSYYLKVIKDGQKTGEFRNDVTAERITFMIMGSMRFCVIQWHLSGFSYKLLPKGEELLDTFFTLLKS